MTTSPQGEFEVIAAFVPHGRDIVAEPGRELLDMHSVEGQRLANVFYSAIAELQEFAFEDSDMATSRMSLDMNIYRIVELRDFAGNLYTLVELSPFGYMIYHNDSGVIVERSPTAFSPFIGLYGDLYYSGFGHYFVRNENGDLLHLSTEEVIYAYIAEAYDWASHSSAVAENFIAHADVQVLDYTAYGTVAIQPLITPLNPWTHVNYDTFIRNQSISNSTGPYCGFVALAILIGYFDHVTANRNMGIINASASPVHVTGRQQIHSRIQQSFVNHLRDIGQSRGYGRYRNNITQTRNVGRQYFQNRQVWNNITDELRVTAQAASDARIMNNISASRPVIVAGDGLPGRDPANNPIGRHAVVAYGFRMESNGSLTVRVNYGWGSPVGGTINGRPFTNVWITGFNWDNLLTFTITPPSSSGC